MAKNAKEFEKLSDEEKKIDILRSLGFGAMDAEYFDIIKNKAKKAFDDADTITKSINLFFDNFSKEDRLKVYMLCNITMNFAIKRTKLEMINSMIGGK